MYLQIPFCRRDMRVFKVWRDSVSANGGKFAKCCSALAKESKSLSMTVNEGVVLGF